MKLKRSFTQSNGITKWLSLPFFILNLCIVGAFIGGNRENWIAIFSILSCFLWATYILITAIRRFKHDNVDGHIDERKNLTQLTKIAKWLFLPALVINILVCYDAVTSANSLLEGGAILFFALECLLWIIGTAIAARMQLNSNSLTTTKPRVKLNQAIACASWWTCTSILYLLMGSLMLVLIAVLIFLVFSILTLFLWLEVVCLALAHRRKCEKQLDGK